MCGGTFERADAFVGYLGEVFREPDASVDYYWVPGQVGRYCVDVADDCAQETEVFSNDAFHKHELTHAVRRKSAYLPMEEAIAELYSDGTRWRREMTASEELLDIFQEHAGGRLIESPETYVLLGHFASYLRASYGNDGLIDLGTRSAYDGSFESFQARFDEVYGEPVADAVDDYIASYPTCDQTFYVDNDFECGRDPVALPGEGDAPFHLELGLGCDEPYMIGPHAGDRWTTITFEVPVTAAYRVSFHHESTAVGARVRRCGISCFDDGRHIAPDFDNGLLGDEHCLLEGRALVNRQPLGNTGRTAA